VTQSLTPLTRFENERKNRNLICQIKIKMPLFTKPNLILIEDIEKNGGLAPSTEKKRASCVGVFSRFLLQFFEVSLEDLISDSSDESKLRKLEDHLMAFFQSMEVKKGLRPKIETAEGYRSHLKMHILKLTGAKVDIRDGVKFNRFDVSF
jgi:hypothetical protein